MSIMDPERIKPIKGVVLAGGKSRRFGEDKALARVGGTAMIERAVFLLRGAGFDPVVITSRERDYSFLNCRIERDRVPGKGPLGGLYTASSMFPDAALLAMVCDMPFLNEPILHELLSARSQGGAITVFRDAEGRIQPFPGIYEPAVFLRLSDEVHAGRLAMQSFIGRTRSVKIIESRLWKEFANVNKKSDLG